MNLEKYFLPFLLGLFFVPNFQLAYAQNDHAAEWQASGSLLHFSYLELNDNNQFMDREDGFLPGIKLGLRQPLGQWALASDFAFHGGNVHYNGKTNSGIPITSETTQNIADFTLQAEYWTQHDKGMVYAPYVGGGYHFWSRNILPTTTSSGAPVSGLLEIYRWWVGYLGIKTEIYQSGSSRWLVDARLTQTIRPTIYIDFGGTYDNPTLPLGERWGLKISVPSRHKLNSTTDLVVDPFVETYELGRSETTTLTNNGAPTTSTVFEPYSQTINYGLSVGISQRF